MSILAPEETMPQLDDDGMPTHGTCCEDHYIGLCGRALPSPDCLSEDEPMTCAECIEADEANTCPKYGQCPWA